MSVFFRLRYGNLRTPLSRRERGSPKQPQRRAAAADCVVSSTRDFSPNARSVRKMRERRVPLYSKNFIKAKGHTQTGVSVFYYFNNCNLCSVAFIYVLSISIPIYLRLFFNEATPVLPTPLKQSKTMSFSFECILIKSSINSTFFCVGWILSL